MIIFANKSAEKSKPTAEPDTACLSLPLALTYSSLSLFEHSI